MLPLLRIIPIGGVGAAVLILVLALTPPREPRHGVSAEMVLARGSLLDRSEHPEWPQFLIQAAFRRAGEMLRLRDLPDTPTLTDPIVLPRERPSIAAVQPSSPPPDSGVESAAKALDLARHDETPAAAPTPMQTAKLSDEIDAVGPPAPAEAAPPASAGIVKMPAQDTAATPEATPAPAETETRVAILPQGRPATDPDRDVTGSISGTADATIPVDIGETSSAELPIVLPPERPPILRIIERERSSHLAPRKRRPRRVRTAAKPAQPSNVQPASEINLFQALFDSGNNNPRAAAPKGGKATSTDNPRYPPVVTYPFTAK